MNQQEILEKAINKAIAGGYTLPLDNPDLNNYEVADDGLYDDNDFMHPGELAISIEAIIFNHDFAKALWGEYTETMTVQNNTLNVTQVINMDGWQYHLQQMVITDDPIAYLDQNI